MEIKATAPQALQGSTYLVHHVLKTKVHAEKCPFPLLQSTSSEAFCPSCNLQD
ncbi:hypothetical protein LEMLEM_LOCUS7294, partial [Lemmus lemmus]